MKTLSVGWQLFLAIILGILLGSYLHYYSGKYGEWLITNLLEPISNIYIHMMKMIVIPIVISTLVVGISGIGNIKQLGRIGIKTIFYFEVITTISIVLGITLANIFRPGYGVDITKLSMGNIPKYHNIIPIPEIKDHVHDLKDIIVSFIPTNIFSSLSNGEILPIIFFSILFGIGLSSLPKVHRNPLLVVFRSISETMFKISNLFMYYSPIGGFALISITVANFGFSLIRPLVNLVILVYFSVIFFALVVLGAVAYSFKLNIFTLIRILRNELILAYSTASSESVLSKIIEKMESYGAPASITNFVVTTGYSFNLDGSTLYQSIASIFISQLYGIDLSLWQEIILVLTLMITSKGSAGVPGISFIVLLTTLGSIGIPLEGLTFIAGVDRILDMARTTLNVLGNALAVLVISKWENKFDTRKSLLFEKSI